MEKKAFQVLNPYAAGIDIGSEKHFVAVPPELAIEPVRSFGTFTQDLHQLVSWLKAYNITTVAMEATGIYWVQLYLILEENGFEVFLINAHHIKNVAGRKSDVLDCQWIQQLHSCG
jgi:transposase